MGIKPIGAYATESLTNVIRVTEHHRCLASAKLFYLVTYYYMTTAQAERRGRINCCTLLSVMLRYGTVVCCLPFSIQHMSYDDRLEVRRENNYDCFVLYCI